MALNVLIETQGNKLNMFCIFLCKRTELKLIIYGKNEKYLCYTGLDKII